MSILVVEDSPVVRNVVVTMLRRAGYTLLEAANGKEAIKLGAAFTDSIDLLIVDCSVAKRDVADIRKLLEEHPLTQVLYTSGYLKETLLDEGSLNDRDHFLQKPFDSATLIGSAGRILAQSGVRPGAQARVEAGILTS
jgi:CheY-like chemotaxis protein